MHVGKFTILRNDGLPLDGGKRDGILGKSVNLEKSFKFKRRRTLCHYIPESR